MVSLLCSNDLCSQLELAIAWPNATVRVLERLQVEVTWDTEVEVEAGPGWQVGTICAALH